MVEKNLDTIFLWYIFFTLSFGWNLLYKSLVIFQKIYYEFTKIINQEKWPNSSRNKRMR